MRGRCLPSILTSMRTCSSRLGLRPLLLTAAVFALALALAGPALASVADEEREGASLAQALDSGKRDYRDLSAQDFELVGEYWMGRMLGSTQTHEAMNTRMRQMLGAPGEERMHELMGRRYARLATSSRPGDGVSPGTYYGDGGSMMGGDYDGDGYDRGSMMGDGYDYDYDGYGDDRGSMMGGGYEFGPMMGNWRQMSRREWQQMMSGFNRSAANAGGIGGGHDNGWRARDVVFLGLAALLGVMLVVSLAMLRPWRRKPAH